MLLLLKSTCIRSMYQKELDEAYSLLNYRQFRFNHCVVFGTNREEIDRLHLSCVI